MVFIPEGALLRLRQIIGDRKSNPPVVGLLPISRAKWYLGIKSGEYPKGIRIGANTTVWRAADILLLVDQLCSRNSAVGKEYKRQDRAAGSDSKIGDELESGRCERREISDTKGDTVLKRAHELISAKRRTRAGESR